MSVRNTKVLLVAGALVLSVLLFIAPKVVTTTAKKKSPVQSRNYDGTIELYVNQAVKLLDEPGKSKYDSLKAAKDFDSLAVTWNQMKRPDIASYYVEKEAERSNTSDNWSKAGSRYYYSVQFCEDKSEIPLLYQSAMRCFSKALKLNPLNNDAKILLASCFVEGTESPMDGISLLREVEKTDSNNIKLQLAFASFSIKSGQYDKAVLRFNKVLRVDSNYAEAYLHLADAYQQLGQTEKTVEMLQRYSAKTTDITEKLEVDKYIKQLKTNINK